MALPHPTLVQRVMSHEDVLRALVVLVAVIAAMAVLTAVFGVGHTGPAYDLDPDPAGALPF